MHPNRQKILQVLFETYSKEPLQVLDSEELSKRVGIPWDELRHEVDYLVEKGHVVLKSRPIRTRFFHTVYITAKGIDLLEKTLMEGEIETSSQSISYNLKNIRALLTEGFTDEELRRLCYDEPAFRPVYDQLAQETGKMKIIDHLLEYAERKLKLDHLLTLVKEHNPTRYEKYKPYYATRSM